MEIAGAVALKHRDADRVPDLAPELSERALRRGGSLEVGQDREIVVRLLEREEPAQEHLEARVPRGLRRERAPQRLPWQDGPAGLPPPRPSRRRPARSPHFCAG